MVRSATMVIIVSALLLFPVISQAGTKAGNFELSPFAGFYDLHKADRFGGGVRFGYDLTNTWGLEAAYEWAGSAEDLYHADILYNLMPFRELDPFIFAGAGLAHLRTGPYNTALGEIGVGFKYAISDTVGFRVDVRDMQEKYNDVLTTAGLTFTFEEKKQAKTEYVPPPPYRAERDHR